MSRRTQTSSKKCLIYPQEESYLLANDIGKRVLYICNTSGRKSSVSERVVLANSPLHANRALHIRKRVMYICNNSGRTLSAVEMEIVAPASHGQHSALRIVRFVFPKNKCKVSFHSLHNFSLLIAIVLHTSTHRTAHDNWVKQ